MIVRTMVTDKSPNHVFDFFLNLKNWETGGAIKNSKKVDARWWEVDTPLGKARIRLRPNRQVGILDHDFQGGAGSGRWTVFCRVTPNESGSTTSWLFIRPDGTPQDQFENQLKNFDSEIEGWKRAIESER